MGSFRCPFAETVKEPRHCVPLGSFRQFGPALRRGFAGFSAENPAGYGVFDKLTGLQFATRPFA